MDDVFDRLRKKKRARAKLQKFMAPRKKQRRKDDEDDIPTVDNHESAAQYEERTGKPFWGNETTGYVSDKDNQ
jgi:hypothetical protein